MGVLGREESQAVRRVRTILSICAVLTVWTVACSSEEQSLVGSWQVALPSEVAGTDLPDTRGAFVDLHDDGTYVVRDWDRDGMPGQFPSVLVEWGTWSVASNVLIFRPDPESVDCTVPSGDGSTRKPQVGRYSFELLFDEQRVEEWGGPLEEARKYARMLDLSILEDGCAARRQEMVHGMKALAPWF